MIRLLKDISALLFVVVVIFFSTSLRNMAGMTNKYFFLFLVAIVFLELPAIWKDVFRKQNLVVLFMVFVSMLLILFKKSIGQGYAKTVFDFTMVPMILSLVFNQFDRQQKWILRQSMLVFFVLECGFALIERIYSINLFSNPFVTDLVDFYNMDEKFLFRSTSLIGHPLRNALVVSIGMTFIAVDRYIYFRHRVLLLLLGYLALFCFNGRTAILVSAVILVPIMTREYVAHGKAKLFHILFVAGLIFGMIVLLSQSSLGGRLFHGGFDDGSAEARLLALTFNDYINTQELWQGGPELYTKVQEGLGTPGVENGVVCMILNYGLLFTLLLLPLLLWFHWSRLRSYDRISHWAIMLVFYTIGVTNPNLAQQPCWIYWVLFFYALEPDNFRRRQHHSLQQQRYRSLSN